MLLLVTAGICALYSAPPSPPLSEQVEDEKEGHDVVPGPQARLQRERAASADVGGVVVNTSESEIWPLQHRSL